MRMPNTKTPMLKIKEKCLVGCPKKIIATLQFEKQIKHEEELAEKQNGSKQKC